MVTGGYRQPDMLGRWRHTADIRRLRYSLLLMPPLPRMLTPSF